MNSRRPVWSGAALVSRQMRARHWAGLALLVGLMALGACRPPPSVNVASIDSPLVIVTRPLASADAAAAPTSSGLAATAWLLTPQGLRPVLTARVQAGRLDTWGLFDEVAHADLAGTRDGLLVTELQQVLALTWEMAGSPSRDLRISLAADGQKPFGLAQVQPKIGVRAAAAVTAPILECAAFPRYEGDSTCTGWLPRLIGNNADVTTCCFEHDQCFYTCPLGEGNACRGTDCVLTCNERIAACCVDQGGDPVQCGLFKLITDLGGGGGRNGCGRDKALDFCARQSFAAGPLAAGQDGTESGSGCDGERCLCEECAALGAVEDPDLTCAACSCVDECAGDEPDRCRGTGAGHEIITCAPVVFDDTTSCLKWQTTPCLGTEICREEANGPACVSAECAREQPCREPGERDPGCHVDNAGPYFNVCGLDGDGCFGWRRQYCDHGGDTACVVIDHIPGCTQPG